MQLLLYLLIGCQAAETLRDRVTDLGQNVKEVNCLLLKLPDPPVLILLTFSTPPHYYNNRFKPKYSVQNKPQLFINNVTADDLGLYYCVTTDIPPKYNNGTRLHIAEIQNHTEVNLTQCQTSTLISALLNSLLIIDHRTVKEVYSWKQEIERQLETISKCKSTAASSYGSCTTSGRKSSAVCCGGSSHIISKVSVQPSQQHLRTSTAAEINNA